MWQPRERDRLREREGREQSRAKLGVGLHASTPPASAAALPLPVAVSCLLALPPPIVAMLPVEVGVVEPPRAPTPLPPSWSWLRAYSGDVVAHLLRSTLARLPFLGPRCCSPPAPGWRLHARAARRARGRSADGGGLSRGPDTRTSPIFCSSRGGGRRCRPGPGGARLARRCRQGGQPGGARGGDRHRRAGGPS